MLESYKKYLAILEQLSKIKPGQLVQKTKIEDENERNSLFTVYVKLRASSITSFCSLIKRHPHFNYRLNILQTILPKLASQDGPIRKEVTQVLFDLLAHEDQQILDFKVDILRELNKVIKSKSHEFMEHNLLDCLVLHLIIVDEEKAKAIADSTHKSSQLHDQLHKLRKKGKLK